MKVFVRLIFSQIIFVFANVHLFCHMFGYSSWSIPIFLCVLVLWVIPSPVGKRLRTHKLRNSDAGCELLEMFLISTVESIALNIYGWFGKISGVGNLISDWKFWLVNALLCILVESITFWNGIIRIYLTSEQLGIKWRVVGAVCGMIPIVNIIVLLIMLTKVKAEICVENEKIILNEQRSDLEVCKTKYPLLLVHGVFFRDFQYLNYWGRIPAELKKNGATIYYGNHSSAASVENCARELDERIRSIVNETGCEKVNIIAHSKGGLDCRYALSELGTDRFVASLTTINTPHRGCKFADFLLDEIPEKRQEKVAATYNKTLKKLGDTEPDFMDAVRDLTESSCRNFNEKIK